MTLQEAYVMGLCDGIQAYAWWIGDVQYVGTTGRTLAEALENAKAGTYPPQPNMERVAAIASGQIVDPYPEPTL